MSPKAEFFNCPAESSFGVDAETRAILFSWQGARIYCLAKWPASGQLWHQISGHGMFCVLNLMSHATPENMKIAIRSGVFYQSRNLLPFRGLR